MNELSKKRGRTVAGLTGGAALAGLAAAFGLVGTDVGTAAHGGVATQQRDVALVDYTAPNPDYDDAHDALVQAQVLQNSSLFDQDIALQQSLYYWTGQQLDADPSKALFVDPDANPLSTNIFNGAVTRAIEAMEVGQAAQQVQWDHLLGVNQGQSAGFYEAAIGNGLTADIGPSGIDPSSALGVDLAALSDPSVQASFSDFSGALGDLQNALWSSAFNDVLGMFGNAF